jgi:parvulin-like peptidyl-prolyl isomerase
MKRLSLIAVLSLLAVASALSQTTIDKPAATIKLTKQEIISVRQIKADVDKLEKATGQKMKPEQVKQVLEARVNSMLFVQFCDREKITVQEAAIAQRLAQMKAELGNQHVSDVELEKAMQAEGIFVDPKTYARQRLLFNAYVQAKKADDLKASQVPPTVEEILKAFDMAKSTLVRPDTIRASVLFVDLRNKGEDDRKKAREVLKAAAATLKLNPDKFDEYLLRGRDGTAGYKSLSSIYVEKTTQDSTLYGKDFFDFAFKQKNGDISGLIESPSGMQVVRINEFLPQKQLGLTDPIPGDQNTTVSEYLAYELTVQKQSSFMDKVESELITQLRKDATIKIYEENLAF